MNPESVFDTRYHISETTKSNLDQLLLPDSQFRILDLNTIDPEGNINYAKTDPQNPAVLIGHSASFCALVLGFTAEGSASLLHEHLLIWGKQKLSRYRSTLPVQFTPENGNVVVAGRWDLDQDAVRNQDSMIEDVFGDETDIVVLGDVDWSITDFTSLSSGIHPEGVSALIFLPRYLATDNTNHVFYFKNTNLSELAKISSAIIPHTS